MILIMACLKLHISTWLLRSPPDLEKNGLDILSLQDTIITMTFITTVTTEIVEELKQHLTDDLENMRPPYKPGLWGMASQSTGLISEGCTLGVVGLTSHYWGCFDGSEVGGYHEINA